MTDLPVSVVIVSRGRPAALKRCLTGVSQLQYPAFEVVVVADPEGYSAAQTLPFAEHLKCLRFDEANISAARNLGLSEAAGEIVAFIDDDAVPEPQWLHHLVAPALQRDVSAMGGFVRGRNGISFQWMARSLDATGAPNALQVDPDQATVLHPPKGQAIKTEGTNMAFRRSLLVEMGGFDPAYRYYLDETDLNMRIARAGLATAIVPLAQVHHAFAPNAQRTRNRAPRDLFEIGASWAVFQRKHMSQPDRAAHWQQIRAHERRRALEHMVAGALQPGEVARLMRRLDAGYAEGQGRAIGGGAISAHAGAAFNPFPSALRKSVMMQTRPWRLRRDLAQAEQRVRGGDIVTLLSLSPTTLYHKVEFTPGGVWLQRGGTFGRSERHKPLIQLTTRRKRARREEARVQHQRGFVDKMTDKGGKNT